jgi:dUTP pyrophosphatase
MNNDGGRGFRFISDISGLEYVTLPARATKHSAGYDLYAACMKLCGPGKVVGVPTGVKAYMQPGEFLQISIRSGLAGEQRLILANGVGIIDSDYYDNPTNEGHIYVMILNLGNRTYQIKAGDRIAQAVFLPYLLSDYDPVNDYIHRTGGFGSTGR